MHGPSFLMLWKVWILDHGELRCLCQEPGNRMGLLPGRCCCWFICWWTVMGSATFHQFTLVPWGPQERRDYEEIERYAALRCRSPFMVWVECGGCCRSLVATVARFVAIFFDHQQWNVLHISNVTATKNAKHLISDCLLYCSLLYPVVIDTIFNVNPYPDPTVKTPYSPLLSMPGMGSVNPWGMKWNAMIC